MTEAEVHVVVDKWVPRLNLQEWHIRIKIGGTDFTGETFTSNHDRWATVHFRDPWDADDNLEETVVHELLHIRFAELQHAYTEIIERRVAPGETPLILELVKQHYERAIDSLATALVRELK